MVDFVDDGVVEALAVQLGEAFGSGEFLDGRDDEVAAHVAVRAEIPGDAGFLPLRPHGAADGGLGLDQDLGAVGDDQDAGRALEGLADGEHIEGGEPGFPEAGGDGDEGAAVVVRADLIEGFQRAGLPRARRVEDRGEIDRFRRDEFPVGLLGVLGVAGDEGFIERRGLLPEIGEGAGEFLIDGLRAGGLADEVPLDAGFERGLGEIAAADDEQAAGGIDDAPGLGVEGVGPGGELGDFREADFERAVFADVGGQRHPADQAAEGLGGSDVEVVADEDADAGLGAEGGEDRLLDEIEAGGLDEGGEEVDLRRGGNALADAFPERGCGMAGGKGRGKS